jgi:hypothetical protein
VANGVFLLKGEASRQRAKPLAGARERSATLSRVVLSGYASHEFAGTPGNGAASFADEDAES